MPRRLRIGWPRQYTAALGSASYAVTGNDVALTYTPAADTTPNAFTFTDQTGAALSTVVTSSAVTISGLSVGTSITLNASGGTIDKNGNANFLGSQLVTNGDQIRARVTSSATNSTPTSCTVVASPSGVQDTFTVTTLAASGTGAVDLTQLPATATQNTALWNALNVSAMAAGTVYNDPVTNVRMVKATASGTPGTGNYVPQYSTLGMSISQPWGANGDQYTIAFIDSNNGNCFLVDYQLGGTTSNMRTFPGQTNGRWSFARSSGNARVMYIKTNGTTLNRYNTATNAIENTGGFPYTWTTNANDDCWLQFNADDTYATAKYSGGATRLRLSDGNVAVQAIGSFDEVYSGNGTVALINSGSTTSRVWDLVANTTTTITKPNANFGVVHCPSMNGYWMIFDPITGGGSLKFARLAENGTSSTAFNLAAGYWGQIHNSGYWQNGSGADQWFLMSCDRVSSSGWSSNLLYAIVFVNASTGACRTLCHAYSIDPSGGADYWADPHATQSPDGRVVIIGSDMLDSPRKDLFIVEVPRAA